MSAEVTLIITNGLHKGKQFTFDSRTTCIIGRNDECNIVVPDIEEYSRVSRYHCLLDINPPNIRIRDFGSKNGTYINGRLIGKREEHQSAEEGIKLKFPEYDLENNDTFQLTESGLAFKVNVVGENKVSYTPPQQEEFEQKVRNVFGKSNVGGSNLHPIQRYTILEKLGEGGNGAVFLARYDMTGSAKVVALKVMLPQVAAIPQMVNLFLREVENAKQLRHPNLVQLEDYCFVDGLFFFTMEYCQGGSVQDAMRRYGGKLPIEIAIPVTLQVLDGLHYAHTERGIVHRDIKPENIFIDFTEKEDVIVKLGDYGLAKSFDMAGFSGQTMTGKDAAMGTPVFMPRQQLLNFKYSKPDVDVWAVAASLYNMLTGEYPRDFVDADPFVAILQHQPIPIRRRDASIPKPLAELIDLALIDDPELYFKSAKQFKQALLSILK
jgi:pSer/pThr/pTyr-binding forkhead associated (FHA) protein